METEEGRSMDMENDPTAAARIRQAAHPAGGTFRDAYTMGRCHVMAVALQRRLGGDLVVLTEELDPTNLVHVGVLLPDGRVVDVEGAVASRTWYEMWAEESRMDARRTSVAELQEMMAHRPITEREIATAATLAGAIAAGIGPTPEDGVRSIPFGEARPFDVPGTIPDDVETAKPASPSRHAMQAWTTRDGPGF